jgi:hypothetical protein
MAVLGFCLLGASVGGALELGAWQRNDILRGPFSISEGNKAIVQPLAKPSLPGISSGSDTNEQPRRSNLQASINGVPLGPPHALHTDIMSKGEGRFSHWGETLVFSLPSNAQNSESTTLEIRYSWRFTNATWWVLVSGLIASIVALLLEARNRCAAWPLNLMRVLYSVAAIACLALCLPLLVFLAVLGWEVLMGHPQRIAGISLVVGENLLLAATYLPQVLIGAAGLIYFVTLGVSPKGPSLPMQSKVWPKVWVWAGRSFLLVLVPATLLLSVARVWGGTFAPIDLLGNMLGGSIPWNDANGHYWGPLQQIWTGEFPEFNMRRPLAACTKSLISFAAGQLPAQQILLQVALLSAALSLAVYKVYAWRGPVASLLFAGVALNVTLPYGPTHLTEPLGLLWALLAVPAMVTGLRSNALGARFLALFFISIGAATRMGNMFLPLFYALWILYIGLREKKGLAKSIVVVAAAFALVIGANSAAQKLYGSDNSPPAGSNFAYVLVGLANGSNWSKSLELYGNELSALKSEREIAAFLYSKAVEQIRRDPQTLLKRLWEGSFHFLSNGLSMLVNGQLMPSEHLSVLDWVWLLLLPVAITKTVIASGAKDEDLLWVTIVLSSLLSAAFVMFDDGWRILSASLIYCGLALSAYLGLGRCDEWTASPQSTNRTKNYAALTLGLSCVLGVVLAPLFSAAVNSGDWGAMKPGKQLPPSNAVRTMAEMAPGLGFSPAIVVGSSERGVHSNAVHVCSDSFARALALSGISQYQNLPESIGSDEAVCVFVTPLGTTVVVKQRLLVPEHFSARWIQIDYDVNATLQGPYFYEAENIAVVK